MTTFFGNIFNRILTTLMSISATLQLISRQNVEIIANQNVEIGLGKQIVILLTPPPPPQPAGFVAVLTTTHKEILMAAKKVAPSLTINDDGNLNVNVSFTDGDGLPETLTTYPSGVAPAVASFADATPGPSAFVFTPSASPVLATDVPNAFVTGVISCVQPVVQPPAQNVDVQVSIASGLAGQTSAISEDAGTLSVVADPNNVAGFSPVLQN